MSPRDELVAANTAIATAVLLLKPHLELFQRFERERLSMDNVGAVLDPTLFRDPERRQMSAAFAPLYRAAVALLDAHETTLGQVVAAVAARHLAEDRET